jgi:3-hydroxybutyryl-CoA dehydrogenase
MQISGSIGIVGLGVMGRGIAEAAISSGLRVVGCKATPGDPQRAAAQIEASLDRAVKKGRLTADERDAAMGRLDCTADLDRVGEVDFVIESIVEDLPSKRALLDALERRTSTAAILATNTSSLSLGEMARTMATPARFVGMHFFSPVPAMKLVEIASPTTTAPETIAEAHALAAILGKTPVTLGDTPGFIVNRLLIPYLLDAMRVLERGVASAQTIDTAMKLGAGHPLGPLALADAIGLDVVLAIAQSLYQSLGESNCAPPSILLRLVAEGRLGKKTGGGLWEY